MQLQSTYDISALGYHAFNDISLTDNPAFHEEVAVGLVELCLNVESCWDLPHWRTELQMENHELPSEHRQ